MAQETVMASLDVFLRTGDNGFCIFPEDRKGSDSVKLGVWRRKVMCFVHLVSTGELELS